MTRNISKLLSLALRHQPEVLRIELDSQGYASVDSVLAGLSISGIHLSREGLEKLVAENDKKRFAFSPDGLMIRASQGHSVKVDLGYEACRPPEVLFHGTAVKNLLSISHQGLVKGSRQHVHLSSKFDVALEVGKRHGRPVILKVKANEMWLAGEMFYLSANGVWLTDHVPVRYLVWEP
jgi:putative RNA 2'-phosphotransferase